VSDVDSAVVEAADAVPDEHSEALNPKIRCVVVDCSSMMFIDCVGTTTVQQVHGILNPSRYSPLRGYRSSRRGSGVRVSASSQKIP